MAAAGSTPELSCGAATARAELASAGAAAPQARRAERNSPSRVPGAGSGQPDVWSSLTRAWAGGPLDRCGRRGQLLQLGRHRGDTLGALALAGAEIVPGAVAAQRQDHAGQQHPAAGNAALVERHRKGQVRAGLDVRLFLAIAVENALAVEAEIIRIGPDEADRVGRPGQLLGAALLDRGEIDRLYAQGLGDRVEVEPELLAALAQQSRRRRCAIADRSESSSAGSPNGVVIR